MKEDWAADNARRALKPKTEAAKAAGRRYYAANKEAVIARASRRPPEERRDARKAWKTRNPDLVQVSSNAWKRRAREAAPKWLTPQQKAEIAAIYAKARTLTRVTKTKYVVDHIVPLRSEVVCGLHVPWNLQILTHVENCAKSNRVTAD
jgi:hypothetical protein